MENTLMNPTIFSTFTDLDWLTTEEAAIYLRLLTKKGKPSTDSVRNLVCLGKIPFYKPFGRLMFRRSDLQKIIETSRNGIVNGDRKVQR